MELIPVLDLMNNVVVRGVAGEREKYQPIQSCLIDGCDPVETALAFREHFGTEWLYVADLNALLGDAISTQVIQSLVETGLKVAVDAGVNSSEKTKQLLDLGVTEVVVALESLKSLEQIEEIVATSDPSRIRFSVDQKNGELLGKAANGITPLDLVHQITRLGIQRFIVLDLAAVGVGSGVPTLELCRQVSATVPKASVWTGGGVRGVEDLKSLSEANLHGVMVASALHSGSITPLDWEKSFPHFSNANQRRHQSD